jgi:hypothetical protein
VVLVEVVLALTEIRLLVVVLLHQLKVLLEAQVKLLTRFAVVAVVVLALLASLVPPTETVGRDYLHPLTVRPRPAVVAVAVVRG